MLRNQNILNLQVQIICARGDKQYIQPTTNKVVTLIVGGDSGHITHGRLIHLTCHYNILYYFSMEQMDGVVE